MFTAAEFRLIQKNCPEKLDALLENLRIKKSDWNSGNEFKIYEKLDDEIVSRVCRLMKSESIIDGYTNLITLGGLQFNYSETDNELLATILQNKEKIQNRLKENESVKTVQPPENVPEKYDYSNVQIAFSRADFHKRFDLLGGTTFELHNRKILTLPPNLKNEIRNLICDYLREAISYNVVTDIEISVQTQNGTYRKTSPPQRNSVKPARLPFTPNEFKEIMKSLNLINDIVNSIA